MDTILNAIGDLCEGIHNSHSIRGPVSLPVDRENGPHFSTIRGCPCCGLSLGGGRKLEAYDLADC